MKEQLIKAMQRNQLIDMIYVSKSGEVAKRRIKIIKMVGDTFQPFCFAKQAKRTFIIENVIAVLPVLHNGGKVI